jgi:hypothetical protein
MTMTDSSGKQFIQSMTMRYEEKEETPHILSLSQMTGIGSVVIKRVCVHGRNFERG